MRFRDATPQDVPCLVPMLTSQYALHRGWDPAKFGTRPGFESGYAHWLTGRTTDAQSVFLVATTGDEDNAPPIAFLIGTIEDELPLYELQRYGFIHDLWVDEPYRHEGVARQLVMLAVERFKELGLRQVRCETAIANGPARNLFDKCGFREAVVVLLAEI